MLITDKVTSCADCPCSKHGNYVGKWWCSVDDKCIDNTNKIRERCPFGFKVIDSEVKK